jgi:hypothetical protein
MVRDVDRLTGESLGQHWLAPEDENRRDEAS